MQQIPETQIALITKSMEEMHTPIAGGYARQVFGDGESFRFEWKNDWGDGIEGWIDVDKWYRKEGSIEGEWYEGTPRAIEASERVFPPNVSE